MHHVLYKHVNEVQQLTLLMCFILKEEDDEYEEESCML